MIGVETLILIILLIIILGGLPVWSYSRSWGYGWFPSVGALILLLIVLVILF